MKKTYDFVIVGGGSAGCALARRLSEGTKYRVALLEAGESDESSFLKAPVACILTLAQLPGFKKFNWHYETPGREQYLNQPDYKFYQPRGKVLGGSSQLNAMIYIRGNKLDYDQWGLDGWRYKDVLPFFKKSEKNSVHKDEYHSQDGLLDVQDQKFSPSVNQTILQSCQEHGLPLNSDFNGASQYGVNNYQVTMTNGERCSSARAFLSFRPPNLDVLTHTFVTKINLQSEAGGSKRAVSVSARDSQNQEVIFEANKEIILSGGAFNSPQLLQLSGIGNRSELEKLGIQSQVDLRGVGENLQDHINMKILVNIKEKIPYSLHPASLVDLVSGVPKYLKSRDGYIASNIANSGGFFGGDKNFPLFQFHFIIGYVLNHGRKLKYGHGLSLYSCLLRPQSRGFVKIQSKDPKVHPIIQFNYLKEKEDLDLITKSGLELNQIIRKGPLKNITNQIFLKSDISYQDMAEYIKSTADTIYHPVGSCKMGNSNDPNAVVDTRLRVLNTKSLRVADASIIPNLISGNTNAPAIMIGEKAAEMILQDNQ